MKATGLQDRVGRGPVPTVLEGQRCWREGGEEGTALRGESRECEVPAGPPGGTR